MLANPYNWKRVIPVSGVKYLTQFMISQYMFLFKNRTQNSRESERKKCLAEKDIG